MDPADPHTKNKGDPYYELHTRNMLAQVHQQLVQSSYNQKNTELPNFDQI